MPFDKRHLIQPGIAKVKNNDFKCNNPDKMFNLFLNAIQCRKIKKKILEIIVSWKIGCYLNNIPVPKTKQIR